MKKIIVQLILLTCIVSAFAQETMVQTVKGTVIDKQSQIPLPGVVVILGETGSTKGAVTDGNGFFKLTNVPIGRQNFTFSQVGYHSVTLSNIQVVSGKELSLKIELEEKVYEIEEITVKGTRKDKALNEMALISARSFTIEETERFAGSWGDPSRMATNYAGISAGGDQINDIIIRGNSPAGVLWRLEGISIPNPNHFGAMGTTGGPISMLNNNVLSNSDFLTGAFPSDYGNALAGAFDLKMRAGNNEKHEFLGQIGFNGFELGAEGPITKKNKASYLANYRYSTLAVMDAIGIDMGVGAIPYYQDLTFKVNIPNTQFGTFSIFGLGGISTIHFESEKDNWQASTLFDSDMGVTGITHRYYFNPTNVNSSRLTTSFAIAGTRSGALLDTLQNNIKTLFYGSKNSEITFTAQTEFSKKFSAKNNIKIGFIFENIKTNFIDSVHVSKFDMYINQMKTNGNLQHYQAYTQWLLKPTDNVSITSGLYSQTISLNKEIAIEPRIGISWKFLPNHSVSAGFGMHSQMQSRLIYFDQTLVDTLTQKYVQTNIDLKFSKANHVILGYDYSITSNLRLKIEAYYQQLYKIPVEVNPSYVSLINYGRSYMLERFDSLVNTGTGNNYGVDITIERFLYENFYVLSTVSIYSSKYKGSDKVLRNTAFNGGYTTNFLAGYEFKIKKNSLSFDTKLIYAGGLRGIPINIEQSISDKESVWLFNQAYEHQFGDYYRADLRITFRMNKAKFSQEWALDIQNVTNHINPFIEQYNPDSGKVEQISQIGMNPMFFWRINF